jgi:hypothetical protein
MALFIPKYFARSIDDEARLLFARDFSDSELRQSSSRLQDSADHGRRTVVFPDDRAHTDAPIMEYYSQLLLTVGLGCRLDEGLIYGAAQYKLKKLGGILTETKTAVAAVAKKINSNSVSTSERSN